MNRLIYVLLFLVSTKIMLAQDSLYFKNRGQSLYFKKIIEVNKTTPANYYFIPLHNYTASKLSYHTATNHIQQVQQPHRTIDVSIGSEGFYRLKKILFTGSMEYSKNIQKEVGWNGSQMYSQTAVEKSPFYYLSYKKGNWDNQLYKVSGAITFPLVSDKVYTTLGALYHTQQFFRKDNPMSKLIYLDLLTQLNIHYKFSESKLLGASFFWGYLNNEINITYSNNDLNLPSYPDLYSRISLGYGLISSARYRYGKEAIDKIGGAVHFFNKTAQNLLQSTLRYTKTHNVFNEDLSELLPVGYYDVSTIEGIVGWFHTTKKHFVNFKTTYQTGSNFSHKSKGINYKSSSLEGVFEYGFPYKGLELSAFAAYNYLHKKDFTTLHEVTYATSMIGAKLYKKFIVNKKYNILWNNVTGYRFKLDDTHYFNEGFDKFVSDFAMPELVATTTSRLVFQNKPSLQITSSKYTTDIGFFSDIHFFVNLPSEFTGNKKMNKYNTALGLFIIINY